jgi:O-glycosyl hydrolase
MNLRELIRTVPLVLLSSLPSFSQASGGAASINLDPNQRFQTMDGFGVNFNATYFRDAQKPMLDLLVKDLGATIFRLDPYGLSDWEQVNDNDDADHINWEYYNDRYSTGYFEDSWAAARYLNSLGVKPFLTVSGPAPEWMCDTAPPAKHKVCQTDEKLAQSGYKRLYHVSPAKYEEFAETLVSMALYARLKGRVDFEYFSPFNETDCYPVEGPRIDPEEAPKVLALIARRLRKEGLGDVRLVVADQALAANDYIGPILGNDELMGQTAVLALHTYQDAGSQISPHVEKIAKSRHPHTRVWLTEYADLNDMDLSFENEWKRMSLVATRRALRSINEGAQAALWWDAFDNYHEHDRILRHFGLIRNVDHIYTPKKRYYAARQLYRFVRPGAQRIAATSDSPALMISAFREGGAGSLILVGVKEGGPNRLQVDVPKDLSPDRWEVYATTRQLDCARIATVPVRDGTAVIPLADEAVFTLVGRETP